MMSWILSTMRKSEGTMDSAVGEDPVSYPHHHVFQKLLLVGAQRKENSAPLEQAWRTY